MKEVVLKPSFIGLVFGRIGKILLASDRVVIYYKDHTNVEVEMTDVIDIPKLRTSFLGGRLKINTRQKQFTLSLLKAGPCKSHFDFLKKSVGASLNKTLKIGMERFRECAYSDFLTDSAASSLAESIFIYVPHYIDNHGAWLENVDQPSVNFLETIRKIYPLHDHIDQVRSEYEKRMLVARSGFFDTIETNPLTEEQRLAAIRDNDRNLVLAAAGTGKTSVMVAKALDMLSRGVVDPSEIILLAYNNSAAKEIRQRLNTRIEALGLDRDRFPQVYTFHALGRQILKESGVSTNISVLAEDTVKLELWMSEWLSEYVKSSPQRMKDLIELAHEPVNPFDFKSKQEYEAYVRDNEFRTLQGELVRGFQELCIANWLFMKSVDYSYEAPYVSKLRVEAGIDYKPDFHLRGTNVYLEHFGIDRKGNTRRDIDAERYNMDIARKRECHAENGTVLIETYHYDWVEKNLEARLTQLMSEVGIKTSDRPVEEMFTVLKESGFLLNASRRYLKCLQAIRLERLSPEMVKNRLKSYGIAYSERYSELLEMVASAYSDELKRQSSIDFDDMIISASSCVKKGLFKPHWKRILVDEFQDISSSRMELLQKIIEAGPQPRLTVVGDDWQSIYRFAGGKLELTTRFNEMVGTCSTTKLQRTFRYNSSISEVAGRFVMQNPEQYRKHVEAIPVVAPQVFLLDDRVSPKARDPSHRAFQVVCSIKEKDPGSTVAILSRYRYLLNEVRSAVGSKFSKNVDYWTFHGSKGLESDYCILIGFVRGKTGFPNSNREESIVEALLPSLDEYPHSEERRLMYVALTRARKKVYVIADPTAPSEFVDELLSPQYNIVLGSKAFRERFRKIYKCPKCEEGYFQLLEGRFGQFYRCSSGTACKESPRICTKCQAPSVDRENSSVCTNADCGNVLKICSRCGRPMRLRKGAFGAFWGCSGYGLKEDRCKRTERLS